jgi:hypothetical protein
MNIGREVVMVGWNGMGDYLDAFDATKPWKTIFYYTFLFAPETWPAIIE